MLSLHVFYFSAFSCPLAKFVKTISQKFLLMKYMIFFTNTTGEILNTV